MPTVSLNGADVYYQERGEGPPALFVHGMCGDADVWEDQVDRLAGRFRCVAYDRRGHGRSSLGAVQQRTVGLHGDDAAALVRALGLAPCLLVGSSSGARVGLDVVRRYPELLGGAVLSEPPLFALDPAGGAALQAELRPALQRALDAGGPRAAVDAFFQFMCPGLWGALDEARRERYRANAGELLPDLQQPPYQVTPDDLARVHVPCLVVRGDHSHPVLMRVADQLAAGLPGATKAVLRGSGHVTYAEQPAAFAAAVLTFAAATPGAFTRGRRRGREAALPPAMASADPPR